MRLIGLVILAATLSVGVRRYALEAVSVASGSMEPTLPVGNSYLVNKLAYRFSKPERGHIIVFRSPVDNAKGMIKRVIGIPGDQIEIHHKQVYVNGVKRYEPYTVYKRANERLKGDNLIMNKVPPGHYVVMGDNRDESDDSTVWKDPKTGEPMFFLPEDHIEGRLIQIP